MFSSQTEVVSSSVGTDKNIINESLPEQSRCSRKGQMSIFFFFFFFAMTWLIPNNTFSQLHAVFNLLPFATKKVRAAAVGSIWHLVGNKKMGLQWRPLTVTPRFIRMMCLLGCLTQAKHVIIGSHLLFLHHWLYFLGDLCVHQVKLSSFSKQWV